MDLQEARRLLWPKYDYLSDEQVQEIVSLLRAICRQSIRKVCKSDNKKTQ
jgi:hypothetical protein